MMTMRATSGYRGVGVLALLGGKTARGKTTGEGSHLSSVSNLDCHADLDRAERCWALLCGVEASCHFALANG